MTQLVQSNLDTLLSAAQASSSVYNAVGTGNGTVVANRISSNFEKNLVTLIAMTEATIGLSQDPTADRLTAERQRKVLKSTLVKMMNQVKVAANPTTDDRAAAAVKFRESVVKAYAADNKSTSL